MPKPEPLDYHPAVRRPRRRWLTPVTIAAVIVWAPIICFILTYLVSRVVPHGSVHVVNRARCSSNLHQIGLAIRMYRGANEAQYPGDVGLLGSSQGLNANVFLCPASNCSYIYVGDGLGTAVGNEVVAFEPPDNHPTYFILGGNVLWGDGHVSWEKFEDLVQLVPELEAGHNPPVFKNLTPSQAESLYQQKWLTPGSSRSRTAPGRRRCLFPVRARPRGRSPTDSAPFAPRAMSPARRLSYDSARFFEGKISWPK